MPRIGRRPSPSMVVALVALFVALGGVGWAATQLPPGSVGTAQLRSGAVTSTKLAIGAVTWRHIADAAVGKTKIAQAAVGAFQIDAGQVQHRVIGACPSTSAVGSVNRSGSVHCNASLPRESGAASPQVTIGGSDTQVLSKTLTAGTGYLVFANPYVLIISRVVGQRVELDCTLALGTATQTRSLVVEIGSSHRQLQAGMPLMVANQAVLHDSTPATVTCRRSASSGATPTVLVTTGISAIQTLGSSG